MRSRGFSVAETIFAAFVLSLVMMAIFNIFPSSAMAVKRAELQILADSLAQRQLETYRATAFDDLAPTIYQETYKGLSFTVEGAITEVADSNPQLLQRARVTVSWTYRGRTYQTVQEAWLGKFEH